MFGTMFMGPGLPHCLTCRKQHQRQRQRYAILELSRKLEEHVIDISGFYSCETLRGSDESFFKLNHYPTEFIITYILYIHKYM